MSHHNMGYHNTIVCKAWENNNFCAEFEIDCEVSAYVAAQLYGPPEKCYPEEGGCVEIGEVRLATLDIYDENGDTILNMSHLNDSGKKKLVDEFRKQIEDNSGFDEEARESASSDGEDCYEDYTQDR